MIEFSSWGSDQRLCGVHYGFVWYITTWTDEGQIYRGMDASPGPAFCHLLPVSSDYAQPITGQVTEVTCPVVGRAQSKLTPSKRQKTGPVLIYEHISPCMKLAMRLYSKIWKISFLNKNNSILSNLYLIIFYAVLVKRSFGIGENLLAK